MKFTHRDIITLLSASAIILLLLLVLLLLTGCASHLTYKEWQVDPDTGSLHMTYKCELVSKGSHAQKFANDKRSAEAEPKNTVMPEKLINISAVGG